MCSIQLESLLNLVEMPWEGDRLLAIPSNEVEEGFQPGWWTISHRHSRGFKDFPLFSFPGQLFSMQHLVWYMQKSQAAQAQEKKKQRDMSPIFSLPFFPFIDVYLAFYWITNWVLKVWAQSQWNTHCGAAGVPVTSGTWRLVGTQPGLIMWRLMGEKGLSHGLRPCRSRLWVGEGKKVTHRPAADSTADGGRRPDKVEPTSKEWGDVRLNKIEEQNKEVVLERLGLFYRDTFTCTIKAFLCENVPQVPSATITPF